MSVTERITEKHGFTIMEGREMKLYTHILYTTGGGWVG